MKKLFLILITLTIMFSCEYTDDSIYCVETNSCNIILTHNVPDSIVSELCYLTVYTDDISEVIFTDSTYTEKNDWFSFYAVPIGVLNIEIRRETLNDTYVTDTMILLEMCQDLHLSIKNIK